jgi:uncharacterized cupin superfamily protein
LDSGSPDFKLTPLIGGRGVKTFLGHLKETMPAPGWGPPVGLENKEERQLAKAAGITQFGVNHLTLQPGSQSSRRHWHEGEDEFVYVLSGVVTQHDENGERQIGQGHFVGFPAGEPNAHHFLNRGEVEAEILVVGTRKVGEERIHYPDQADPGPFGVVRDMKGQRVPK